MPALALVAPLAPSCPDFPETKYRDATVVCEGPSACLASALELAQACLPGPIIAVNRAIAFSDRIPVDVWATLDDPNHLWNWAKPHLHRHTKLFSSDSAPSILFWRDILGDAGLKRLYTREPTYMDELTGSDGEAPLAPTVFHVLAWLLQVGVKRVRLVGCDMDGSGSPLGPLWSSTTDEGHTYRWLIEREFLRLSEKHYRSRGARLERWSFPK